MSSTTSTLNSAGAAVVTSIPTRIASLNTTLLAQLAAETATRSNSGTLLNNTVTSLNAYISSSTSAMTADRSDIRYQEIPSTTVLASVSNVVGAASTYQWALNAPVPGVQAGALSTARVSFNNTVSTMMLAESSRADASCFNITRAIIGTNFTLRIGTGATDLTAW